MNRHLKISLILLFINLFAACYVGMTPNTNFTYLDEQKKLQFDKNQFVTSKIKIPKEKIDSILIFVEGEKLDFEYQKIGLIEIDGAEYSKEENLLTEIKELAARRDCNAIINFKKDFSNQESGILFSKEPLKKYTSKTLSGIAVKIVSKTKK